MRKNIGSALVDYAIPTLLVGVVFGVGLFSFVSGDQLLGYLSGSQNMEANKADGQGIIGSSTVKPFGNINPGDLNGTPSAPQTSCNAGSCIIDYGDYILTGVPEDFANLVKSAGPSDATDKICALLEQLAAQEQANGDKVTAKALRDLANLGYFNAKLQQDVEVFANTCINDANPKNCMYNATHQSKVLDLPSNIASLLPAFDYTINLMTLSEYNMGQSMSYLKTDPGNFDMGKTKIPNYKMVEIFDNFMQSSNPDSLKNIVKELYMNLSDIATDQYSSVKDTTGSYPILIFDPITGAKTGLISTTQNKTMTDILKPDSSNFSDVNSTLICIAGKNQTDATACH